MPHPIHDDIQHDATSWYVRLQNPQLPASERIAFRRWLDQSAAHSQAFHQVEQLWQRLDSPARQLAGERPQRRRKRAAQWLSRTAAACLLLALGALCWRDPGLLQRSLSDYASAPGQQRQIQLADGSQVLLDADSALDVHFSPQQRRVRLLRGRAWFDVSHAPQRPFVVDSGELHVQVLGTAFAVDSTGAEQQVTVSRGRVEVSLEGAKPLQLTRNQQASSHAGQLYKSAVDSDGVLAWRQGLLVFDRATLDEVVHQLRRSDYPPVLLLDPALGQRRISGTFLLSQPQQLIDTLSLSMGVQATRVPGLPLVWLR